MSAPMTFYNASAENLTFEEVFERIVTFIKEDPRKSYTLSIGTDSQVHPKETRFISAIHIHRVGKGSWGCLRNYKIKRKIDSLHEKISMETTLSQEIAYLFTTEKIGKIIEILIPYIDAGADLSFEIHLDIGKKGLTKDLINEMTARIEAIGIDAKIKPDSYTASSYANKFTK